MKFCKKMSEFTPGPDFSSPRAQKPHPDLEKPQKSTKKPEKPYENICIDSIDVYRNTY